MVRGTRYWVTRVRDLIRKRAFKAQMTLSEQFAKYWQHKWSDAIGDATWRYEFFRKQLEYNARSGEVLGFLHERYAEYFPDVNTDECEPLPSLIRSTFCSAPP